METPWTISGIRVLLSSPTESWERGTELDLLEGPEFLQHGGETFIIYSTRESWLRDYRLGALRLRSAGADPMHPDSWTKSGPVFTGTADVYGVGHASFTTSPDGTEHWIVYHSKTDTAPGWQRAIRMQRFTWNADGSPNFGLPAPSGKAIPMPAGQCG
jgi:GH43 family beta-xylosidase